MTSILAMVIWIQSEEPCISPIPLYCDCLLIWTKQITLPWIYITDHCVVQQGFAFYSEAILNRNWQVSPNYIGTMQTLDTRHIELFPCEGFQNGNWDYQLVGSHDIKKRADGAAGAIFDMKHLEDSSTSGKSWYFQSTYLVTQANVFLRINHWSSVGA